MIFIADFIACSTCFGHHYAHHQELESIIQMVAACGIWCFGFQVVSMVWASNKICNKYHLLHLVGILFPCINDDARSESLQIHFLYLGNKEICCICKTCCILFSQKYYVFRTLSFHVQRVLMVFMNRALKFKYHLSHLKFKHVLYMFKELALYVLVSVTSIYNFSNPKIPWRFGLMNCGTLLKECSVL